MLMSVVPGNSIPRNPQDLQPNEDPFNQQILPEQIRAKLPPFNTRTREEKVETRYLVIDSKDRDKSQYPYPSAFKIPLKETIPNIRSVEIVKSVIPETVYNINYFKRHLGISSAHNSKSQTNRINLHIPTGNYKQNMLLAKDKKQLEYIQTQKSGNLNEKPHSTEPNEMQSEGSSVVFDQELEIIPSASTHMNLDDIVNFALSQNIPDSPIAVKYDWITKRFITYLKYVKKEDDGYKAYEESILEIHDDLERSLAGTLGYIDGPFTNLLGEGNLSMTELNDSEIEIKSPLFTTEVLDPLFHLVRLELPIIHLEKEENKQLKSQKLIIKRIQHDKQSIIVEKPSVSENKKWSCLEDGDQFSDFNNCRIYLQGIFSQKPCGLSKEPYAYIYIPEFDRLHGQSNIVDQAFGLVIFSDHERKHNSTEVFADIKTFRPARNSLNEISIQFRDRWGNLYDFNQRDIMIVFAIKYLPNGVTEG